MKYIIEYVDTKEQLDKLYNNSAFTIEGLAEQSIKDLMNWLSENTDFTTDEPIVYVIKGKAMNEVYELVGSNAYKDDLTIISVIGINQIKIAIPRFSVGARWFDDIVDNNESRE